MAKENKEEIKEVNVDGNKSSFMEKIRANPWIASTIVFGLALVVVLIFYGGGMTGGVVSSKNAGQNLIDFVNARGYSNVTILSAEREGLLYKMSVNVAGQKTPVYVTVDGKYLVQPIPLTETATTAGTNTDSGQQQQPANVPKTDKPKVEVFVMSHCPYGTQIEKGAIPVAEALGDKIDFSVKFVDYAMHGEKEIKEQMNQYCIQSEQNDKFLTYLKCFLKEGNGDACLTEAKVDKTKMASCVSKIDTQYSIMKDFADKSKWLSGTYPPFNIHKTENDAYGVQGSPTLVINGVQASAGRDSASLMTAICGAFNTAPDACKTAQMSSTQPSPGFGYSAASGSTGSATCG